MEAVSHSELCSICVLYYTNKYSKITQARAEHINEADGKFEELTDEVIHAKNNEDLIRPAYFISGTHVCGGLEEKLYYKWFIEDGTKKLCLRGTAWIADILIL
ncbi:hypothetical protein DFH11DRAFT_1551085 [Phellopilus nigrolimitatus]|nr:hypothetical protein DFH11DRAFT_1551085 [Phellopilus nigrolimitatus]